MGWVEVNRTTTTTSSTYDSVIQHPHFPWSQVITVGGGILTLAVTLWLGKD